MKIEQIAAQLYTLRAFTQTAEDFDRSMAKVAAIGYRAVQVSAIGPIDPHAVAEICAKHHLTVCATHVSFERLQRELPQVAAEHRLWGCSTVGIGSMPEIYRKDAASFRAFAKEASDIGRRLKAEGLTLIYHDHRFEFEKFPDGKGGAKTGMEILLEESDPEALEFELDTYWVQSGGADPVDWVRRVAGRMSVVHLKDMGIKNNEQVMAEVGEGNIDFARVLAACDEIGVKWAAVEQDICPGDPFDSLALSFRNLEKLTADAR